MKTNEVIRVLSYLKVAFPHSRNNLSEADLKAEVQLWETQFKDFSYESVMMAVNSYISSETSGYFPTIGKLKEMIFTLSNPDEMTELEAWALVKKAVGRSGYYSQEEFDKLPPTIQKLVGSPRQLYEWSQTDSDEVNTVIASNFQRSYKVKSKQVKEFEMLPNEVKGMISTVLDRKLIK